jgi:hypothetical protein
MATWDGYNQSIIANRFQKSFMVNYVDLSGRLLVRQDASFNNRLFVMNDASFMGNIYVDDILTTNLKFDYSRDASYNKRLFVQNDASFMANVYVDDILTTNLKMISIGDTSLNSNVVVGRDISCNGNINIGRNITVLGNIAIKNYTATNVINTTTTNYSLAVVEDISLNGRVSVSSDTSLNGNLFISRDISLNGNVNGTVNFINNISVNGMNVGGTSNLSTFCGNLVGSSNTHNTLVGYKSFTINALGTNTGLGFQTGLSTTSGAYNTAVGSQSLNDTTTGDYNVGIGYNSGTLNPTGSNMTAIGYGTVNGNPASVRNNTTIIGADNTFGGSGRIEFGIPSQTLIIPRIERFLTPPMMIRTISSAVSFNNGSDTVILWGTLNYAGSNVAISYNATTGVFSNAESHTIGVSVSVSFVYASNPNYNRALWIKHSNVSYSRVGHMELQALYVPAGEVTGLNVSANFTLNSSESFTILGWQNSGGTLLASSAYAGIHPCRIMITTY